VTILTLYAPAKVNYLLDVVRKRPDGYHDLRMIMQRIDLSDTIILTTENSPGIRFICSSTGVPDGPDNIAWKAAQLMLDLSASNTGIRIEIKKNIPITADLDGGSSDAATILIGMNELLQLGQSDQKLMAIGQTLGADVPFFIFKETAVAEGIGEKLTPLPQMPKCWLLLVNPMIYVSTAWVFQSLQLTNETTLNRLPKFFESIEQVVSILSNDLESVTISAFPVIAEIKARIMELGAAGSLMSGSGPTVFGVFKSFDSAESARQQIAQSTNWFTTVAETL
jgi:4-diphosphocytidyl-2-C-methyl-D-erythritol kinase